MTHPQKLAKEFLEELARTERNQVKAGIGIVRCAILEAQAQALETAAEDLTRRGETGGPGRWLRELAQMKRDEMDLEFATWKTKQKTE